MKTKFLFSILILLIVCTKPMLSQVFGEEDKQRILADLDSTGYEFLTLKHIIFYNITEAVPILELKFWGKSMTMRAAYLDVMAELNSPNTATFAYALIDSADNTNLPKPLITKLRATKSLVKVNNFSTVNYIFEWLEEYHQGRLKLKGRFAIMLLPKLLDFPEYETQVKQELIYVARNEGFADYRSLAADALIKKYGDEFVPFLLERVSEDTTSYVRWNAFKNLRKLNYNDLHNLIKERLPLESEFNYRVFYADTLLKKYGQPSDYLFLKDYLPSENHPYAKEVIGLYYKYQKPPKFSPSLEIVENIDSLISYSNQLYSYGWIGDEIFVNSLIPILEVAKSSILNSDSLQCRIEIHNYQQNVDNVFKDSLNSDPQFVLREGWNILYWNAQYILDRLPEIPPIPDVEEIIPSLTTPNDSGFTLTVKGANFTINSVVYWNGTAKSTGYLSDSSLSVDINPGEVSSTGNIPVWVIEQVLSSDTLEFRIVSSLPESVEPVVECIRDNGDGSYTAYFGYNNNNNESVFIPVSSHNKISPSPWDRGQPGVFLVGRVENVFTVDFNSGNIIWHLNNRIAKASKKTELCP